MNAQTTAAIASSLSAIDKLNSNSPTDPTKTNMFFVSQAAQAVVQELVELQRTTPEKKKYAKEAEPITLFVKGGTSQPKTTPVKSACSTGQTSNNISLLSTTLEET